MRISILITIFLSFSAFAGNNLHQIDKSDNGYSLYRSGKLSEKDLLELCQLGVTEIMVLSGDANKIEKKYQDKCPALKVIYNVEQDARGPLSQGFLSLFDRWIKESKLDGKKIAIRGKCGCYRVGRLSAYYQMRYKDKNYGDAMSLLKKRAKNLWLYPNLKHQVRALQSYFQRKPCPVKRKYCVTL